MKKAAVVLLALMMALTCAYGFAQANGEDEMTVLGQGEKSVMVLVVDDKGGENAFEVRTDEAFLMDALVGVELIEVEEVSPTSDVVFTVTVSREVPVRLKVVEHNTAAWETAVPKVREAMIINDFFITRRGWMKATFIP